MARKKGAFNRFVIRRRRKKKCTVDRTQCKNCLYQPPNYEGLDHIFGCYYIIYTGKRRPSEPSPNCTAFKKYNRAERKKLEAKLRADSWKGIF